MKASGYHYIMAALSPFAKRLDKGRFIWPQTTDGVVSLTAGQVGYLLEAIDWRNPQQT